MLAAVLAAVVLVAAAEGAPTPTPPRVSVPPPAPIPPPPTPPPDVVTPPPAPTPPPPAPAPATGEEAPPASAEPAPATGEEGPPASAQPAEPAPAAEEAPPAPRWMEASREAVEGGVAALVYRFDRFFGDPSHLDFERPRARIRLRNEVRLATDRFARDRASVLGDVRLPALNRLLERGSVFLSGGNDEDVDQVDLEDPVRRSLRPTVGTTSGAAEVRFDLWREGDAFLDVGAGVRLGWPPPPRVRARWAQGAPLGLSVVGHVLQTIFWERRTGFGEATRADVERAFGARTVARISAIGTLHEHSRALEWGAEGGVQRALDARTGVYGAAAAAGATSAPPQVDVWRVFGRLRRDAYARWVFVEVEPEVSWPADALGHRSRVYAFTIRVELLLDSTHEAG